ncbi:MAG TPA: NUDIX domain-containing protein [Anaerolineales bacterium]|nr:NUDIX domain-containing protein [Anaerolineales bacterium]
MKYLLKIWRVLPLRIQIILSRIIRPLFQVFAAGVIFDPDNKILLVKSTYQRFHPWGLPGGSLDYGESPEDAVKREVWEETGLHVQIKRLLLVKTWSPDRVGLYYLCEITGGKIHPTDEVSEADYFSLDALPDVRSLDVDLIKQLYKMAELKDYVYDGFPSTADGSLRN